MGIIAKLFNPQSIKVVKELYGEWRLMRFITEHFNPQSINQAWRWVENVNCANLINLITIVGLLNTRKPYSINRVPVFSQVDTIFSFFQSGEYNLTKLNLTYVSWSGPWKKLRCLGDTLLHLLHQYSHDSNVLVEPDQAWGVNVQSLN